MSVFVKYLDEVYPYRYSVALTVDELHGGVPANEKVAAGWLRTILEGAKEGRNAEIVELAREIAMGRLGIDPSDPDASEKLAGKQIEVTTTDLEEVVQQLRVNGFSRDRDGVLSLRRKHLQAMLKENSMIAWAGEKWGPTKKGTKGYWPEHFFVVEDWIPITVDGVPVTEPHQVHQSFVHKWNGSSIKYEEAVFDATVSFTILTDLKLTMAKWAELWLRAERNGLGASRSQGYGSFTVKEFRRINTSVVPDSDQ